MALCHSLASYGATLPSFLVSTRNQSKSDSPRAFLSPLLAAPSQLLIAFQRSTMLVRRIIALRETFPSLPKSDDILERSAILSEEWKLDATPTFSDDGATTRSERNGREFGVEASLHFYETPSHPHSSVYNGFPRGVVFAFCSPRRSFTRAIPARQFIRKVFSTFSTPQTLLPLARGIVSQMSAI